MLSIKFYLITFLIVCLSQVTYSQELNEDEFEMYKTKLEDVKSLQKNGRYAQSYEQLKEIIEDLKGIKNSNLEIAQFKRSIYMYTSFCFDNDPGGRYFYKYKEYLMELAVDEVIYQGYVDKFGVKTAKSYTKK